MFLDIKIGRVAVTEGVARLRTALRLHLERHLDAYGSGGIKPKHHWLYDAAEQFLLDGRVFDALVVERLHLRSKAAIEPISNLRSFETSALASMMNHHEASMASVQTEGLVGRTAQLPGAPQIMIADAMESMSATYFVGDIVFKEGHAAEILACLSEDTLYALLRPFEFVREVTDTSSCWRLIADAPLMLSEASALRASIAWYWSEEGIVVLSR